MKDGYSAYPLRAHASLMPFDAYEPGAWLLTGIDVAHKERGQGVARELMRRVLRDADRERVVLCLAIHPDGTGLDHDQLRAWYKRLGFKDMPGSGVEMVRQPR